MKRKFNCILIYLSLIIFFYPIVILKYPLLYQDTAAYIQGGFVDLVNGIHFDMRSPFYSYFLRLSSLAISLYFVVVVQIALTWYVLCRAFSLLHIEEKSVKVLILLLMALFSTVPWYDCFIMPDVFSGFIPLFLFVIFESKKIKPADLFLLVVCLLMHTSNVMTLTLTLFACIPVYLITSRVSAKRFVVPFLAVVISFFSICSFQFYRTGKFQLTEIGTSTFLVNRWINDRVILPFLDQICAIQNPLVACAYRHEFSQTQVDGFWNDSLYISEFNGFKAAQEELRWLAVNFIKTYPFVVVLNSIKNTGKQFANVGIPLWSFTATSDPWKYGLIFDSLPLDAPLFDNSRIHSAYLRNFIDTWLLFDKVILNVLSLFALALCLCVRNLYSSSTVRLYAVTVLFYIVSVWACATISGPFERFAGRISWTVMFSSLCVVLSFFLMKITQKNCK